MGLLRFFSRNAGAWRTGTLALLALNGAYLYAYDTPSFFYIFNVALHAGLGTAASVGIFLGIRSIQRVRSVMGWTTWIVLAAAGMSGLILFWTGTARPYQWLLWLHIGFCCVGLLLLLASNFRTGDPYKGLAGVLAAALFVAFALPALVPDPVTRIQNPVIVPTSMQDETEGQDSPFFPSSATTDVGTTIPSDFFMKSESCGRSGCHPDIVKQWSTSAHHLASFNNQWYRKSIEYMQDVVGTKPSKWCAGCHDHAMFFSGMMDTPVKEQIDLPEAHTGLGCTSCHSISAVKSTMGNGSFTIEYPPLHDLATSENPVLQFLHDFVVELDPGPHKQTFMKPFMREQTSEYCSACHKVHLDVPVNNYRWIRGFNEYDGWQSSGVSGQGARSFYYPDQPKGCADCHMPLLPSDDAGNIEGAVHDHRFPAANTALAVAHQNVEQLKLVTDFLQNDQVRVDIFALSEAAEDAERATPASESLQVASTFAEGDEMGFAVSGRGAGYTEAVKIVAPIDRTQPQVHAGSETRIDVVVRTKGVGHFFPGGTVDAYEVWVELKAEDAAGNPVFWSGYVPEDELGRKGPVDPAAHFYRSVMLDGHGNRIDKRNAWATRSVAYVRLIPPGAADTIHYRLPIPNTPGQELRLTAKVNYRKFSWVNTHFSYAGVAAPDSGPDAVTADFDDRTWVYTADTSKVSGKVKEIPEVPIVTMARAEAVLRIVAPGTDLSGQESVLDKKDLIRWNDYGIGLLLQGDLKAAEEIFRRVTEIDDSYVDGWVNIGRSRVLEGRTEEAQEVLLKAAGLVPGLARTDYFLGLTYKNQGDYEKALEHFRAAASQYPKDRVVLNQIGRILFLQRRFDEAVATLEQVLTIDPEDLQAHYNLMLCFRALRDTERAAREQQLYMRFKADENAQAIAGPYLREHPEDNNERQAIHEHATFPLDRINLNR